MIVKASVLLPARLWPSTTARDAWAAFDQGAVMIWGLPKALDPYNFQISKFPSGFPCDAWTSPNEQRFRPWNEIAHPAYCAYRQVLAGRKCDWTVTIRQIAVNGEDF